MRRLAWATSALVLVGFLAWLFVYLRRNVVPPDCSDGRTLAMVRQSLVGHFGFAPGTRVENVHMLAGGPLAFRFVCEADLTGFDPTLLGRKFVPGFVRYTSQLTHQGQRHDVSVEVLPLLMWEKVR